MSFNSPAEESAPLQAYDFGRKGKVGVLTFSGSLTVECSARLRETLMVSLEHNDYLVVHLRDVTEVDVYCMQMFCSAHRISVRSNKRLTLTGMRPEVLRQTVDDMKSLGMRDCAACCDMSCLWVTGPPVLSN